jgi:hypothetical protein
VPFGNSHFGDPANREALRHQGSIGAGVHWPWLGFCCAALNQLLPSGCDRLTGQPTRTPTMLEVKASGNTVYIEQFPNQVQSKTKATFHGCDINFPQWHATSCHKFFPKWTATSDPVTAVSQ